MATSTQVLLDVYLRSVYEPDVDYVDGELEERNAGEFDHSILQQEIAFWFSSRARAGNVRAVIDWKCQERPSIYRSKNFSGRSPKTPLGRG